MVANGNPVSGRTKWDFLTELLSLLYRIGPTTIVVGGFLFFAYIFYQEVNKARIKTDELHQKQLTTAREQLITTYEKIGGMSDQLIANINNLLELSTKIDERIASSHLNLYELNNQLKAARDEAERATRAF